MTRKTYNTDKIAPSVGPFSAAVEGGGLIFFSGQIALDPATSKLIDGDVTAQTERIFTNIGALLEACGKSFDHVVKTNVYLTDIGDFSAMNAVYSRYFSPPYAARTTVAVAALPLSAKVEIEIVVQ